MPFKPGQSGNPAGKPKGAIALRTRAIAEQAAKNGKSPLEIMLANMLHFQKLAESAEVAIGEYTPDKMVGMPPDEQFKYLLAEVKKAAGLRQSSQDCARDAAPYCHARISSESQQLTLGGPNGKAISSIEVHFVTPDPRVIEHEPLNGKNGRG